MTATDAPEAPGGLGAYHTVRRLLHLGVQVFFRRIEVVDEDNVPPDGATLFCGNHSNSMLDPVLITVFGGRVVHFAAADVVFENAVLRFFLKRLRAVPIRRRQDHEGGQVDNQAAFAALFDVLAGGGAMGIFPEGLSHDDSQLAQLRTGPARLSLGALERQPSKPVRIVPCGFYYTNPKRFRSSVLIQFGEPIEVGEERLAHWKEDERGAVRALTDDLEMAIRALTVNAEDWETAKALDAVRRLYQPPHISLRERATLAHRFNLVYPQVAHLPEVKAILARVQAYQEWLEAMNLKDDAVRRPMSKLEVFGRGLGHLVLLLVYLPLAAMGAPVHVPVGLFVGWGGRKFAPRPDVIASTKFTAGMLLLLLIYGAAGAAAFHWLDVRWAAAVSIGLPLSGLAYIRVLYRARALTRLFKTTAEMLFLGRALKKLRAEREELVAVVNTAVDRFIPEDMERLFPSPEGGENTDA